MAGTKKVTPTPGASTSQENDNEDVVDDVEEEKTVTNDNKAAAQDMTNMHDEVEETDVKSSHSSGLEAVMLAWTEQHNMAQLAKSQRVKELSTLAISAADIEVMATEFDIEKATAESLLRESNGDLECAMKTQLAL